MNHTWAYPTVHREVARPLDAGILSERQVGRTRLIRANVESPLELVEYIESTVESVPIEATDDQKGMLRSRAAELQADPSIGLTWDELDARMGSRWK